MADVITRLKVDSQEYDSKLKNAVSQMNAMEQQVRRTGASFAYADKEELDFVKSLGQLSTQSNTAKGKLSELTNAFTELSVKYRNLTAEEKSSPFGKAMAQSLDQLKGRIKTAQGDLTAVKTELGGMGDVAQQLGAKLGVPVQMFTKMGPIVAAAAAAIKVATDAISHNEELLDGWKATTEAAKSTYNGFLNALNTGDISGFLSRIGEISSAAREAYNALDRLGTFNAFNQINLQRAQTAYTNIEVAFREGTANKSEVRAAADTWKNELEKRRQLEMDTYLARIRDVAKTAGVDADLLTKALSGSYGDYESLKAIPMPTESVYNSQTRSFNDVIDYENATDVQKLGQALRQLNDTQLQELQGLGLQAEKTATEIADIDKRVARVLRGGQTKTTTKATTATATSKSTGFTWNDPNGMPEAGSLADLESQAAMVRNSMGGATTNEEYAEMEAHLNTILAQIRELKGEMEVTFEPGSLNDLNQQLREAQEILANLAPDTEAWAAALQNVADKQAAVNALTARMGGNTAAKEQASDARQMGNAFSAAANIIGEVGGALNKIEDPSAKIAGLIAQAIASVAAGLGEMLAQPAATSEAWGWVALAISGTATMLSTIASIKAATDGFAGGGMVEGNSYSGDNIVARLNAGEGVLTAAGVSNAEHMANSLGNPFGGMTLSTKVSGTDLMVVLDYTNRSLGGSRGYYIKTH